MSFFHRRYQKQTELYSSSKGLREQSLYGKARGWGRARGKSTEGAGAEQRGKGVQRGTNNLLRTGRHAGRNFSSPLRGGYCLRVFPPAKIIDSFSVSPLASTHPLAGTAAVLLSTCSSTLSTSHSYAVHVFFHPITFTLIFCPCVLPPNQLPDYTLSTCSSTQSTSHSFTVHVFFLPISLLLIRCPRFLQHNLIPSSHSQLILSSPLLLTPQPNSSPPAVPSQQGLLVSITLTTVTIITP